MLGFYENDLSNGPSYSGLRSTRSKNNTRSFACLECNYSTTRMDNLRRHELVHSGDRPFKCCYCSKSFTQKSHLKKHSQTHFH